MLLFIVNVVYNLIPAGLGNIAVRAQGLFGEAVVRMFRPPGGGGGDIGAAAAAAAVIGGEDTFCELCQVSVSKGSLITLRWDVYKKKNFFNTNRA